MRRAAAAAVTAALGLAAGAPAADAPPGRDVTMPGKVFSPAVLDVLTGTTVTWRNGDRFTHTVTAEDDSFDSGFVRPGATFAEAFSKPGTYAYHCSIHRFMHGEVRVFDIVLVGPDRALPAGAMARLEGLVPAGVTEVVLQRVSRDGTGEVGRTAPGPDGSFAFTVRAAGPAAYQASGGTASSPRVRVGVSPHVLAAPAGGGIAVSARPARPGSRVALQVYDRERFSFVTVARARLDERSQALLPFRPEARAHVRAVVRGREGWSDGVSRVLVVTP